MLLRYHYRWLVVTGAALSVAVGIPAAVSTPPLPWETAAASAEPTSGAIRLPGNPIITPALSKSIGTNINGPSLIRVPEWVANPLGRYYLYFADHGGKHIRLAYADRLAGPWRIHEGGVLSLTQVPGGVKHIASPDALVDEDAKQIRLYFHTPVPAGADGGGGQRSRVALSGDGIHFTPRPEVLGQPYFRVFRWRGAYYALATRGPLYRSADGLTRFEPGPVLFGGPDAPQPLRHCAVDLQGDALTVYYSRVGDSPERILRSTITLTPDWREWTPSDPATVLEPERDYEGAGLPVEPSRAGAAKTPVRQLRDPAIYVENGRRYLLYSVAGESGIAIAELH